MATCRRRINSDSDCQICINPNQSGRSQELVRRSEEISSIDLESIQSEISPLSPIVKRSLGVDPLWIDTITTDSRISDLEYRSANVMDQLSETFLSVLVISSSHSVAKHHVDLLSTPNRNIPTEILQPEGPSKILSVNPEEPTCLMTSNLSAFIDLSHPEPASLADPLPAVGTRPDSCSTYGSVSTRVSESSCDSSEKSVSSQDSESSYVSSQDSESSYVSSQDSESRCVSSQDSESSYVSSQDSDARWKLSSKRNYSGKLQPPTRSSTGKFSYLLESRAADSSSDSETSSESDSSEDCLKSSCRSSECDPLPNPRIRGQFHYLSQPGWIEDVSESSTSSDESSETSSWNSSETSSWNSPECTPIKSTYKLPYIGIRGRFAHLARAHPKPTRRSRKIKSSTKFVAVPSSPEEIYVPSPTFSIESSSETPVITVERTEVDFTAMYRKGLLHDSKGRVDSEEMHKFLNWISTGTENRFENGPHASFSAKFLKPSGRIGIIPPSYARAYRCPRLPGLTSPRMVSQLLEIYAMALVRDIPFARYPTSTLIREIGISLSRLPEYPADRVDPYTLFRGPMYGDIQGPYISQFLYVDISTRSQRYLSPVEGIDFLTEWDDILNQQQPHPSEPKTPTMGSTPRYILTGRDLGWYLRSTDLMRPYLGASEILINWKMPFNLGFRQLQAQIPREQFWVDGGIFDLTHLMATAIHQTLIAIWHVKWSTLLAPPESVGMEVEIGNISSSQDHPIIRKILARTGSRLLPQMYPDGCPHCPSFPSHFAAVAGAAVTVLKFFFDSQASFALREPDASGSYLIESEKTVTVGDELNKLATNLAYAGMWAGINYRMDGLSGLRRGERIAIAVLENAVKRYPASIAITFPRFNDQWITIAK